MSSPDQASGAAQRLARIVALEAQRADALLAGAGVAQRETIGKIVARQHADALAFARRTVP